MSDRSIKNRPIVINKSSVDIIMAATKDDTSISTVEALGLYTFYYYTALWQATPVIRATVGYTSTGLGISDAKVRRIKKLLTECGLIEDVVRRDAKNKICGHYVLVNYYANAETIKRLELEQDEDIIHPYVFGECGKLQTVGSGQPNAYRDDTLNAYRDNRLNACKDNISCASDENFEKFWAMYLKKSGKKDALKAWRKIKPEMHREILEKLEVLNRVVYGQRAIQYVPMPATWLNGERWNDNPIPEAGCTVKPQSKPALFDYDDDEPPAKNVIVVGQKVLK